MFFRVEARFFSVLPAALSHAVDDAANGVVERLMVDNLHDADVDGSFRRPSSARKARIEAEAQKHRGKKNRESGTGFQKAALRGG